MEFLKTPRQLFREEHEAKLSGYALTTAELHLGSDFGENTLRKMSRFEIRESCNNPFQQWESLVAQTAEGHKARPSTTHQRMRAVWKAKSWGKDVRHRDIRFLSLFDTDELCEQEYNQIRTYPLGFVGWKVRGIFPDSDVENSRTRYELYRDHHVAVETRSESDDESLYDESLKRFEKKVIEEANKVFGHCTNFFVWGKL